MSEDFILREAVFELEYHIIIMFSLEIFLLQTHIDPLHETRVNLLVVLQRMYMLLGALKKGTTT